MTTQETLEAAQRALRTLERESEALPGRYATAAAAVDLPAMRAIRGRQAEIGDELGAARVAVARAEIADAERELRAFIADAPYERAEASAREADAEMHRARQAFEDAALAVRMASGAVDGARDREGALQERIRVAKERERALLRELSTPRTLQRVGA